MTAAAEWSDFKILLALARGGSVAGAARELGVDSSTVSRRLAALEESLGVRLVVRGRELAWTNEGRAALAGAEAMQLVVDGVNRACREAKQEVTGAIRVSMPPSFVPLVLGRMIPALRERHPTLKLDVHADYRKIDLGKGEADLAVRMFKPSEPDHVARRAFENGWVVYTSDAYSAAHGVPATFEDLKGHHVIVYEESMHSVEGLRWLESYRGRDFVRVDNIESASQLISAGTGIGVLPACCEGVTPTLHRVFPEPIAYATGFVVYHEAAKDIARVRIAVEALLEFFGDHAALFSGRPNAR